MADSRFQITQEGSVSIVQFFLPATLDAIEIDGIIDSVLQKVTAAGHARWLVDLSNVQYLGSSMLGLFVNIRERIRQAGGTLVLCGMSAELMRIFRTCCLERLFVIAHSRNEAMMLVGR